MRIHPPYEDYIYFRQTPTLPQACIDLCIMAYDPNPTYKQSQTVRFGSTPRGITSALISNSLRTPGEIIVAFRGTMGLLDWLIDLDAIPTLDGFHQGFAEATDTLIPQIIPLLRPGNKVVFTGHSLGGAMAAIAAARLHQMCDITNVITFGQPRIGKQSAVNMLAGLDWDRYVHGNDVVPTVPPTEFGFVHGGTLVELKQVPRTWKNMFSWEWPFLVPLKAYDHIPVLYSQQVWGSEE